MFYKFWFLIRSRTRYRRVSSAVWNGYFLNLRRGRDGRGCGADLFKNLVQRYEKFLIYANFWEQKWNKSAKKTQAKTKKDTSYNKKDTSWNEKRHKLNNGPGWNLWKCCQVGRWDGRIKESKTGAKMRPKCKILFSSLSWRAGNELTNFLAGEGIENIFIITLLFHQQYMVQLLSSHTNRIDCLLQFDQYELWYLWVNRSFQLTFSLSFPLWFLNLLPQ